MKWVLRYLKRRRNYCIIFDNSSDEVCNYVDSYFVDDLDIRRSTSGYVFTLVGDPISCMSILQDVFSICTTEEQYLSTSHACKEEIRLKWFLGEFGRIPNKVKVLCDSQISIYLPKKYSLSK